MFLLWHPSLTAINLAYTFPILETSATALCGTTGNDKYTYVIVLYIPFSLIYYQTHYHLNLEACSSQLPVPEACVTSSSQVHHPAVFPAVNQFNSESVEIFRSVATTRNMRRKVQPRMVNVFFLHCLWLTAHCCLPEIFQKHWDGAFQTDESTMFLAERNVAVVQFNTYGHAKVPCCLYGPIYFIVSIFTRIKNWCFIFQVGLSSSLGKLQDFHFQYITLMFMPTKSK